MNILETIIPKSDQINADDLIGGPMTITISGVSGSDTPEQPVKVNFDGDGGKPFKPCKSMRRVMVHVWGPDAAAYVGRSMTIYCDPGIQFGGMKVGGIRISHMSHLDAPRTLALTATKGKKVGFVVKPLAVKGDAPVAARKPTATTDAFAVWVDELIMDIKAATSLAELVAITSDQVTINERTFLAAERPELATRVDAAATEALALFEQADEPDTGLMDT